MASGNNKKGTRRLSKGQRKHVRRLKQAARKEAGANNPQARPAPSGQAHKQKQDQS